jgi:hypothetical protein
MHDQSMRHIPKSAIRRDCDRAGRVRRAGLGRLTKAFLLASFVIAASPVVAQGQRPQQPAQKKSEARKPALDCQTAPEPKPRACRYEGQINSAVDADDPQPKAEPSADEEKRPDQRG